ncbi:MAG: peptide chain release factor N(5)-glutamine methyltransferase [Ruminococcaceae bacterium]|nr:peptide chain release factor N(5)-glutamine methyltransferase [Oscillospiraceae bacterium]
MNDIDILGLYFKGKELENAIKEYENGRPAAYIIGEWEFFGDRYLIDESCLIPRCDTERVVETVLKHLPENGRLADLCTGSGCIAISVLKRKPFACGKGIDISSSAIEHARKNAVINGVENRLDFSVDDVLDDCLENEIFDVIVSNPPYIPTKDLEKLDEYVKKEPTSALDGGDDGMVFYDHIVSEYGKNLRENGLFIFEIGYDQEEKIRITAEKNGFDCTVTKDYSGNPRVALLKKTNKSEEI